MTTDTIQLQPSAVPKRSHAARRKVMRWIKRGVLGAGGIAVVAMLIYAWLPKPPIVDTATVHRAQLEVEVDEDGQTRVRDRFMVAAPISGNLDRIELEAGATVHRGSVLGQVRPSSPALLDARSHDEAVARLASALAHQRRADTAITRATAARDAATRDADRARALAGKDAIPASERERYELTEQLAIADRATAEVERNAAAAEVAAARATLGDGHDSGNRAVPVLAPVDGQILKVVRDSAGPVMMGATLLEIGDPHALEITVDVLSSDAARIAPGMRAELAAWGGDRPLRGHVRIVEPSGFTRISALGVEEQRVKVVVALDETPPTLGDGFRVEARIVTWQGDTTVVPASAVFRDHERWAVYAIEAGRAHLVPVELGHHGRVDVELTSGPSAGTTVIVHPGDRIVDGVKVTPR